MDAFFSKIVFGDYAHKKMCLIVLIYTFSLMYHNCVYNYFRGKFNFILSGFLQLLNLGIIPMVGLYFATNVFQYFLFMSVFTFGILIFTNFIYIPFLRLSFDDLTICFKKLTGYGIQRVPGDVVLGLLFSVPVFIASNYFSITIAGNIAFCLSLFNIIIALMSPVNIIILPQASRLVFEKNYLLLKKLSNKLLILSILIGVLALGTVYLMGDWILMLFGVTNYAETSSYLMIIFIGVIGFSVFSVIRSIIDAYYDSARISIIILLAFIIFMISMIFVKTINIFSEQNTLIAFSLSINILGLLAFLSLIKILNTHRN